MQPHACLKSPSYYGMSSCTVQERKRQEDLQVFVSDRIFLWTLPFLSGLKCLCMDAASRKAKGRSQEQHKAFTYAPFHLEMTWALSNPSIGDWFQTPLHPVSSFPSLPPPAPPKSLKPPTHPSFLQSSQQDLTGDCAGSIPGCGRLPPALAAWLEPAGVPGELSRWTGPWLGC